MQRNQQVKRISRIIILALLLSFAAVLQAKSIKAQSSAWDTEKIRLDGCEGYISKDKKSFWITGMEVSCSKKTIRIPRTVGNWKVTKLEPAGRDIPYQNLFFDTTEELPLESGGHYVETVIVPDTVTEIGAETFCLLGRLKKITLPSGLKKFSGKDIFAGDGKLRTLELPASLVHIDGAALSGAHSLEKLKVAKGNRKFSAEKNALYSRNGAVLYIVTGRRTSLHIGRKVKKIKRITIKNDDGFERWLTYKYPDIADRKVTISKKNKTFIKKGKCIYYKKNGKLLFCLNTDKNPHIAAGVKKINCESVWGKKLVYANKLYLPKTLKSLDLRGLPMNYEYLQKIYLPMEKMAVILNKNELEKMKHVKIYVPEALKARYIKSLKKYKKYCKVCIMK